MGQHVTRNLPYKRGGSRLNPNRIPDRDALIARLSQEDDHVLLSMVEIILDTFSSRYIGRQDISYRDGSRITVIMPDHRRKKEQSQ